MSGGGTADRIAVDWGTTNLRAWAMGRDGTERAQANSRNGMGAFDRAGQPARKSSHPGLVRVRQVRLRHGRVAPRVGRSGLFFRSLHCLSRRVWADEAPTSDPRLNVHVIRACSKLTRRCNAWGRARLLGSCG